MQRRLAFNIFAFGAAIALVVTSPTGAPAQSLLGNPDKVGVVRMLDNSCRPHAPAPLGTTIAGVFIPAIPGTMARFECVGPDFREQTFTCGVTGLYDVVVAGAQGGRGPTESLSMPRLGRFAASARGMGGLGGVVRGRMILKAGTVLFIDVGQRGGDGTVLTPGGGGGGTFVLDAAKNPIAVAAGGGGSGYDDTPGLAPDGFMTVAQKLSSGQGGGTSQSDSTFFSGGSGGGGAGFYANGQNGVGHALMTLGNSGDGIGHADGGFSYANGLFGGYGGTGLAAVDYGGTGGFGGGGGAGDAVHDGGGGGGGGYAGGAGGAGSAAGDAGRNYAGSLLDVTTDTNPGDGYVTISLVR